MPASSPRPTQSRRQIERNLHDGAQQHLVALAVKLGLARQLLDADPATVGPMLEELRGDAQETLTQLRELAHGIYPPLLMDRGLGEALRAAANRAVLSTDVVRRRRPLPARRRGRGVLLLPRSDAERGQARGRGRARHDHRRRAARTSSCFEVADNGAGFDATHAMVQGHGFVNMADRVGAIGGSLAVESAAGAGTKVRGRLPLDGRASTRR